MFSLQGKTALVTGASKGVGKGVALGLAKQGCDLILNYNSDAAGVEATAAEIRALGRDAFVVQADVGYRSEVERMCSEARRFRGKLDILVNNAGVQTWKPLLDLEDEDWDRVLRTNLKGCFLGTQVAAKWMIEQGVSGRIVNIGSGSNKLAFPNLASYTASKGGIEMLTKVAAAELGQYGITVNCVAPGAVEIERTKLEAADYGKTWANLTPIGRVGNPSDVAAAVCFLAGDESAFVTGQTIWVDGGLFAKPAWPYSS